MIEVPAAVTISGVFDFGRERRDRERRRRHAKAGHERDLLVDDQLLRDALGVVGNRAVILDDEFDLLAGDGVAMLRHVELDGRRFLLAGRLLLARHRQNEADLDRVLRERGICRREAERNGRCNNKRTTHHGSSSRKERFESH